MQVNPGLKKNTYHPPLEGGRDVTKTHKFLTTWSRFPECWPLTIGKLEVSYFHYGLEPLKKKVCEGSSSFDRIKRDTVRYLKANEKRQ